MEWNMITNEERGTNDKSIKSNAIYNLKYWIDNPNYVLKNLDIPRSLYESNKSFYFRRGAYNAILQLVNTGSNSNLKGLNKLVKLRIKKENESDESFKKWKLGYRNKVMKTLKGKNVFDCTKFVFKVLDSGFKSVGTLDSNTLLKWKKIIKTLDSLPHRMLEGKIPAKGQRLATTGRYNTAAMFRLLSIHFGFTPFSFGNWSKEPESKGTSIPEYIPDFKNEKKAQNYFKGRKTKMKWIDVRNRHTQNIPSAQGSFILAFSHNGNHSWFILDSIAYEFHWNYSKFKPNAKFIRLLQNPGKGLDNVLKIDDDDGIDLRNPEEMASYGAYIKLF